MKRIAQFRFYSEGNENNYPKWDSQTEYESWSFNLLSKFGNVSHLGIQGEPGVVFYINSGHNPIQLGQTGIYELDFEGIGKISKLYFDWTKLNEFYSEEKSNSQHRLIVDIVYDSAEV